MSIRQLPSGIEVRIRQDLSEGSRGDTTLIIDPIITKSGHRVTMDDIGIRGFGKIDQNNPREEIISWTGMTDNGTTYTLTGVVWGINFHNSTGNFTDNMKRHISGAKFSINTDMHYIADNFINKRDFNASDNSIGWGDGTTAENKVLEARNGTDNLPFIVYNETVDKWLISNDGINTYDIVAGGGGLVAGVATLINSGAIDVQVGNASGVQVVDNKINIVYQTNPGLSVIDNKLGVKIKDDTGLIKDADGLWCDSIDPDNLPEDPIEDSYKIDRKFPYDTYSEYFKIAEDISSGDFIKIDSNNEIRKIIGNSKSFVESNATKSGDAIRIQEFGDRIILKTSTKFYIGEINEDKTIESLTEITAETGTIRDVTALSDSIFVIVSGTYPNYYVQARSIDSVGNITSGDVLGWQSTQTSWNIGGDHVSKVARLTDSSFATLTLENENDAGQSYFRGIMCKKFSISGLTCSVVASTKVVEDRYSATYDDRQISDVCEMSENTFVLAWKNVNGGSGANWSKLYLMKINIPESTVNTSSVTVTNVSDGYSSSNSDGFQTLTKISDTLVGAFNYSRYYTGSLVYVNKIGIYDIESSIALVKQNTSDVSFSNSVNLSYYDNILYICRGTTVRGFDINSYGTSLIMVGSDTITDAYLLSNLGKMYLFSNDAEMKVKEFQFDSWKCEGVSEVNMLQDKYFFLKDIYYLEDILPNQFYKLSTDLVVSATDDPDDPTCFGKGISYGRIKII